MSALKTSLLFTLFLLVNTASAISNPASSYCVSQGGEHLSLFDKKGNEYGFCSFKSGYIVDEWWYYRNNQDHSELEPPGTTNPTL